VTHNSFVAVVCRFVPCLILSIERKGVENWKMAGRKSPVWPHTGDPWPHLEVERAPGRLTPRPKISYIFGTGRLSLRTSNLVYGRSATTRIIDMRGDVRAEKSPVAGAGAYWGGSTTGRTACCLLGEAVKLSTFSWMSEYWINPDFSLDWAVDTKAILIRLHTKVSIQ